MSRARSLLAFHAVRTEGGLLPQDILQRVALEDKTLPGLTPEAYHLPEGERFRDAVNRAWSRLTVAWRSFRAALDKLPEGDPATTVTHERWLLPLFDALGYGCLPRASTFELNGKSYAISHAYHKSPIHLLGCRVDLDTKQKGIAGAAAASPHGLIQDFLNRSDGHLWGLVSNGYVLRILRDHHSLTQQAYVEFDLQAILEGEAFSEFFLLFLVCHQSRVEADKPEDCWLEKWFQAAREEGVRALEKLRAGVVGAIAALGSGFLKPKQANKALLQKLESGDLDKQDYYRQLLRLAYRLIFLFVAEDRGALLNPVPKATEAARARYERFYSTKRLRDLADKRRGGPHGDLWQQLRLVMNKLGDGSPELALPALGSFLWSERAIRDLRGLELANEDLLGALRALCYVEQGKVRYAVSWRNIGAEELGSVYESLLELHPSIHKEAARFELDTAAGHERKTTGSYYTPTSLVDCLLDSALDPVLDEAAKKADPEKAILELKVCDPACGSGHFLVAAARRMAVRLARVRAGDDEPSPPEVQRALRDVVGRCIYGVDLNPMAVELCKVSLWMEAIEPGKPLSFLGGHIQQGNALLGATPALMAKGIPDEAFEPIEGDDKEVAKRLKKRNKKARATARLGKEGLFARSAPESTYVRLTRAAVHVEEDKDEDLGAVQKKEGWEQLTASEDLREAMFLADAWCAAFVWQMQKGDAEAAAITEDLWRRMEKDVNATPPVTRREVRRIAQEYSFFHWHLAFPQVFFGGDGADNAYNKTTGWSGGFDVMLGNPPWDQVQLDPREWFVRRLPSIAEAEHLAARREALDQLEGTHPALYAQYLAAKRANEASQRFIHDSGRYPFTSSGRLNTAPLFAESATGLLQARGRAGLLVPSGIATDSFTQQFFQSLVDTGALAAVYSFENEERIFPAVHHATRFCILSFSGSGAAAEAVDTVFFARRASDLRDAARRVRLTRSDFAFFNPNTRTCPTFRWRRDADILRAVHRRCPAMVREGLFSRDGDPWQFRGLLMFMMNTDSVLFCPRRRLEAEGWRLRGNMLERDGVRHLPLYEAKMIHLFDHRFGTYEGQTKAQANVGNLPQLDEARHADPMKLPLPDYWIAEREVEARLAEKWTRGWMLGWRDICRTSDVRTMIAAIMPRVAVGHTMPLMISGALSGPAGAFLLANMTSFALDYCARQKLNGTHLTFTLVKQLPILTPDVMIAPASWSDDLVSAWLLPRVLELTYTAWDLEPFARDCGHDGPPFRWDEARRFLLRCELDAAFFHLYGIARDDVDYILETFPIVKRRDIAAHGSFRTKTTILDIYDRMQRAITTGEPYQTLLDPPPADPRVAHVAFRFPGKPSKLYV